MADIQHNSLETTNLHVPGYAQPSDPGAVGAGKMWTDTSGGAGFWVTKMRNATNTAWEVIGVSGYSGINGISGYSGYSGGGGGGGGNTYLASIINGDLVGGVATVVHSLNSRTPLVGIYDNSYNLILPDGAHSTDLNTLTIDLSSYSPLTGTWYVRVTV